MTSTVALKRAIKARLEAELPARLEALALSETPVVYEYLDYEPDQRAVANSPQVWVTVRRQAAGGPAAFGGTNALHTRVRRVEIGVTSAGNDLREAEDLLYGLADTIQALMLERATITALAGYAREVKWVETQFGTRLSVTGTDLFRVALLSFDADRWGALGAD